MNIIKGFAINRTFINNTPGVVNGIGELSTLGFTYAKEPRLYSSQAYPTLSLAHFPSKDSDVGYAAPIPDAQRDHILRVANTIYTKSLSSTSVIPPGEFVEYLLAQMGSAIADVTAGGTVVDGTRSIIEWVQWRNTAVAASNVNKVWFSDKSFLGQYDEYEIVVIPPFKPVSQFFTDPVDVKTLLKKHDYQAQMEMVQAERQETSETVLWGKEYNYVSPVNKNDKTPAKFSCLIYGGAGNNIDIIREAIVDYLLKNSTQTRDQWKEILPDLFLRTEFLLFPQWRRMAVEHVLGGDNGIYSPIVDMTAWLAFVRANAFQYTTAHVNANAQSFAFPYMSVAVGSVGHVENREGKMKLTDWFPDFFFTPNTSADFRRMSKETQGWSLMMNEMLMIARDLTTASTVPPGYSRVTRNKKLFLSKSYMDVQYLVWAGSNP